LLSRHNTLVALLICALGIAATPCLADTVAMNAARDLARKIATQLDPKQTLHAEFRDLTSAVSATEMIESQRTFENELTERGFHFAPSASAQILLKITLSADSESRLWVAEFTQESHSSVAIVSFALPSANAGFSQGAIMLQRQLILSQPQPILDYVFTGPASDTNASLLVLSPASISVMRFRDKSWQLNAMNLFQLAAPTPRDLQGRITLAGKSFEARFADIVCSGMISDLGGTDCSPTPTNPWQFIGANGNTQSAAAARGRNWFTTIATSSETSQQLPFFAVAGFAAGGQSLWAVAGTDGLIRAYAESGAEPIAALTGFGSQVAALQTGCGAGWQVLTTRPGDYSAPDAVQAQEWTGREFRAVGAALGFEGPVLALRPGSDGNSARAIVRNLKSNLYEAYSLNILCDR
jgi:hypothetical protein